MRVVLLVYLVALIYAIVEPKIVSISSSDGAFAAIKSDGSVVTWGDAGTRCFVLFLVFLCCGLWLLL